MGSQKWQVEKGNAMSEIKAGVTLMHDFCRSGSNIFQSYIDYLDRDEAQRTDAIQTYNLYHDYMGNPLKSTGLFTKNKDNLILAEKRELKQVFDEAQNNGSIMWQTVISYDNRWLEQNGIYDAKKGYLDEVKIKEVVRLGVTRMLEKEGLENAVWSAAIHFNTDNIHVHVATVEPYPTRELIKYQGQWEYKGKFKLKNLEACKSAVINEIMQTKEVNKLINQVIRNQIVQAKESRKLAEDPEIRSAFIKLYQNIPNTSRNLIYYNNNLMVGVRPIVDHISELYLNKYHKQEYEELKEIIHRQSELYAQAYGNYDRSYEINKIEDIMERLGNAVLKEVKEYSVKMEGRVEETQNQIKPSFVGWGISDKIDNSKSREREHYEEAAFSPTETKVDEAAISVMVIDEENEISLKLFGEKKKMPHSPELEKELEEAREMLATRTLEGKLILESINHNGESNDEKEVQYSKWFAQYTQVKEVLFKPGREKMDVKNIEELFASGSENPFLCHFKGELQEKGMLLPVDPEKANQEFAKAYMAFTRDEPDLVNEANKGELKKFYFADYIQYRIGKQLDRGLGVSQNKTEAAKWYEKSGTSYAQYALGNLYFYGQGVEQNYDRALKLYLNVGNNGFASLKCAEMYQNGLGCETSPEQAEYYYKKAFAEFVKAEENQPDDIFEYQLGRMLYYGQGHTPDLEASIAYLELATDKKNVNAAYLLSKIYIEYDMNGKIPKAIEMLSELADKGEHIQAQYTLGRLYILPESDYYDLQKGISYLEKAANKEHEYAQYYTGKCYSDSELKIYDIAKGVAYLEAAKEQGNDPAKYRLGKLYLDSESKTYQPDKGLQYIQELAEEGHEFAQIKLGCEYLKGVHVQRSVPDAEAWLTKASEQGNEIAAQMLRDISSNGPGQRGGRGRGELDKALTTLQRSMDKEHMQTQKIIREYELDQDRQFEQMQV